MIRVQRLPAQGEKDILRFFHDDDAPAMAPFDADCTVHWADAESMWIHGLLVKNGPMTRKWMLELLEVAERGGAVWIKSKRADGHRIPGGIERANGEMWVHVPSMRARFPFDTNFASI